MTLIGNKERGSARCGGRAYFAPLLRPFSPLSNYHVSIVLFRHMPESYQYDSTTPIYLDEKKRQTEYNPTMELVIQEIKARGQRGVPATWRLPACV
jgi:hypothetical protein